MYEEMVTKRAAATVLFKKVSRSHRFPVLKEQPLAEGEVQKQRSDSRAGENSGARHPCLLECKWHCPQEESETLQFPTFTFLEDQRFPGHSAPDGLWT